MQSHMHIGKLVASTGLKGELILQHNLGKKSQLEGIQAIFLGDKNKGLLPYFLETAKSRSSDEVVVKLEGVDTLETARKLTPREVWIPEDAARKLLAKDSPLNLLGYFLYDKKEPVGEITEIIDLPHHLTVAVDYQGNEALVPIHPDNLISLDHEKKEVIADIPDGLLDIYLNK